MRRTRLDPTKTGHEAEALEFGLRNRVIGQEDAIHQVVDMYQTYLSGMSSPRRPIANLMFLGPTGSGKTRLVEGLAECLLGDSRAIVKIDCAEFQHSHEIAKLVGSPPGYLGHRETNPVLTQEALDRHYDERHIDHNKNEKSFVLGEHWICCTRAGGDRRRRPRPTPGRHSRPGAPGLSGVFRYDHRRLETARRRDDPCSWPAATEGMGLCRAVLRP
jgi:AAA domain (Cdc48 subfamily)